MRRQVCVSGLVGLALVACGGSTGPDEIGQLDNDIAMVAAEVAAQDLELMRGPAGNGGFGLLAVPGRFECDDVSRANLSITRTCTFRDANGDLQAAFDSLTTASVELHLEVAGAIVRGEFTAEMDRQRDLTVSGLAGRETAMTWDGAGAGELTRVHPTRDGGQTEFDLSDDETVAAVVIPVPRSPTSWPTAGTITKRVVATITGGPRDGTTVERDVSITFDGSQYATVVLNGQTYTVDLASRRPTGAPTRNPGGRNGPY